MSYLLLLLTLANRVIRLSDRLALNAREKARKGGILGTNYFLPFWVCRRSKTGYPKPLAAIKVPARPIL